MFIKNKGQKKEAPKRAVKGYGKATLEDYMLKLLSDAVTLLLTFNRAVSRDALRQLIEIDDLLYKHLLAITGQDHTVKLRDKVKLPPSKQA